MRIRKPIRKLCFYREIVSFPPKSSERGTRTTADFKRCEISSCAWPAPRILAIKIQYRLSYPTWTLNNFREAQKDKLTRKHRELTFEAPCWAISLAPCSIVCTLFTNSVAAWSIKFPKLLVIVKILLLRLLDLSKSNPLKNYHIKNHGI